MKGRGKCKDLDKGVSILFHFIYFIKYASEMAGYGMYNMDLAKHE